MDRTSSDLGSAHVLNITNQEQQVNIPSTLDHKYISEPISIEGHLRAHRDIVDRNRETYMETCVPLYVAAITGDWEAAKVIFDKRPELVRFAISQDGDTPLHIAVSAQPSKAAENFVENLVSRMKIKDLEIENDAGDNAHHIVVVKGSVKMLEVILKKHKTLFSPSPDKVWSALKASTQYGNRDMALHLYNVPIEKKVDWFWTDNQRCTFIVKCISGDMFDIALELLAGDPKILSIDTCLASLDILAQSPYAFARNERGTIWRIIDPLSEFFHSKKGSPDMDNQALGLLKIILKYYPTSSQPDGTVEVDPSTNNEEDSQKPKFTLDGILITAAKTGNTRFVIEFLKIFPNLIWAVNEDGLSIFHIAVVHRHIGIYNILYEIGAKKDIIIAICMDEMKINILDLVGMTSNNSQLLTVSRASLLMQRELLWFMEVEKMTPPWMRIYKNKDGLTPYESFSENNKVLISKGLKWTKDCMVVATLIITIAFAAAFTVPGGYNQQTGIPIFAREPSFLIFIIADAVSLFSSSTSLLVFLSIITSPYGQRDFLYSLPRKLMIGLVTLIISVSAMMITFAASFFVLYRNTFEWLPILISVFAAAPVIVFAVLQYPLLMDMFRSMYDSRYLFNPKRRVLYNRNQKL